MQVSLDYWYSDDSIVVVLEKREGLVFGHLTINKWNKTEKLKLSSLLEKLTEELRIEGYSTIYAYNKDENANWYKFMLLLGFDYITSTEEDNSIFAYKIME